MAVSRRQYLISSLKTVLAGMLPEAGTLLGQPRLAENSRASPTAGKPDPFGTAGVTTRPIHRISVADREQLQQNLDRYGSIQLDANADYRSAAVPTLVVPSGARIFGGWNTRVPQIVIRAGTSDVVIEHVRHDAPTSIDVLFSGHGPIENVRIVGGSGGPTTHIRVKADTGTRIDRLSLSEFGGLEVSHGLGGSLRNSVFQRLLGYWPGPQVAWQGNVLEPSHNNFFLGISAITPKFGSTWKDLGELWLIGWDCETWNMQGDGDRTAFAFSDASRIMSIGLSGGTNLPERSGSLATFRAVSNLLSWYQHGHGGHLNGNADLELDGVRNAVFAEGEGVVTVRDQDLLPDAHRVHLNDPNNIFRNAAALATEPAPLAAKTALLGVLLDLDERLRSKTDRPRPARREFARQDLRELLPSLGLPIIKDASRRIQELVDQQGIARLADGIYVLEQPVRLGNGERVEGILGNHRSSVILTTMRDTPLIVGRGGFGSGPRPGGPAVNLVLGGMTLLGGSHGVLLKGGSENIGNAGLLAFSSIIDVLFTAQSKGGFWAEGIYGLDANFWHKADFVDMPVAIRGIGTGMGSGLTYCDKQHFLDCQFLRISEAAWFWTADRSSGGHVWTDCYFQDVGSISKTRSAVNLLWTNCVFEDIAGPAGISILDGQSTATYYFYQIGCLWRGRGPTVVAEPLSANMGPLFLDTEFAQSGGSLVAETGRAGLSSWNSRITGSVAAGHIADGVIIDSRIGAFGDGVSTVSAGQVKTYLEGRPGANRPRLPC